jgi:hypothetical protein
MHRASTRKKGLARRLQTSTSTARHLTTIGLGAGPVMVTRTARMLAHGFTPSSADTREMHRMVGEKVQAFGEGWMGMARSWADWQRLLWREGWQSWARLFAGSGLSMASLAREATARQARSLSQGFTRIADAGLAPISRRVASNAKRLGKRQGSLR